MSDTWVLNASPIIVLAKVGHLDILSALASEVLIPTAVVEEVRAGAVADPARRALEAGWGKRVAAGRIPEIVQEWSLGAGESEVITLALEGTGRTAMLDEAEGRMCPARSECRRWGRSASCCGRTSRTAGIRRGPSPPRCGIPASASTTRRSRALEHVGEGWRS